jgi:RNA polymerase sigma-70 factor (ECF subfamily)
MVNGIAFETLMEDAYKKVYDMAYRLSNNRQDAEDLTQEACLRAYRAFESYEGDRPFLNWMYRIVTRLYLDLRRSRRRRVAEVSLDAPVGGYSDDDLFFDPADSRPNPEEALLNATLDSDLVEALEELSPSLRHLVQQVDVNGVDNKTAAVALSRIEGTVRSRLHRAHRQMRASLVNKSRREAEAEATVAGSKKVKRVPTDAAMRSWTTSSISSLASQLS